MNIEYVRASIGPSWRIWRRLLFSRWWRLAWVNFPNAEEFPKIGSTLHSFVAHDVHSQPMAASIRPFSFPLLLIFLSILHSVSAIKFNLPAFRYPPQKCIWNAAHTNALVIVTANVGPGTNQRTDIEIVDSSPQKNVYLSKKGIKAETRLAITTHAEGEVGVCLRNYIEGGTSDPVRSFFQYQRGILWFIRYILMISWGAVLLSSYLRGRYGSS